MALRALLVAFVFTFTALTLAGPSVAFEGLGEGVRPESLVQAADQPPADVQPGEGQAPRNEPAESTPDVSPQVETAADAELARQKDLEYYEMFKMLVDTMDQVERNYVKDVSRRELMEAAIRGVLDKLDPYSNYIGPDELGRFKQSVESQFGGIGIQVDVRGGLLTVVSPLVGSPAYRAGLQAGDAIVEIEGENSEGIDIDQAIRRLKGEPGTKVTITVASGRTGERKTVTIEREIIRMDTVMGDLRDEKDQWDFMLDRDKHIGYIRLTAFSRETARDLERALGKLQEQKVGGLILDLRGNPGGLLTSAIEVADLFLSEGTIVSTSGRSSPKRSWEAQQPGTFEGFPMVVLVNRFSASASEIVSASLQDHQRAIVVGERTWGKGSVQNVIEMEDGKSALKLTTASYQRPNGHNIHRFPDAKESDEWGVMPDAGFEIKLDDNELGALMRYRYQRDILLVNHSVPAEESATPAEPASEPAPSDSATEPESTPPKPDTPSPESKGEPAPPDSEADKPFVDRQLQKAVEYLTTELAKAE